MGEGAVTSRLSASWPTACGRTTSTSAGRSPRCSAPAAFFAEPNLGTRVQGPVEFITGAARALELLDPPPSTLVLADWSARLGQDLFNPPNVGGWPGGRSWLSARSLIGRANFATALVEGRGVGRDASSIRSRWPTDTDEDAIARKRFRFLRSSCWDLRPMPAGSSKSWRRPTGTKTPPDAQLPNCSPRRRHSSAEQSGAPSSIAKSTLGHIYEGGPMPTRREMLKASINGSALVALSPTVPAFLAQRARAAGPERDGRVLVVIQLEGGNDAINTLVPFADEGYARNRKVLRMPEKD